VTEPRRALATLNEALSFRPVDAQNPPPEDALVLVRYKEDRPETQFNGVSRFGASVYKNRVCPALPVYSRAPYAGVRLFRGFVVLAPQSNGVFDGGKYMDGDVADAFDGWMPIPA
jgi:hypothetical protein